MKLIRSLLTILAVLGVLLTAAAFLANQFVEDRLRQTFKEYSQRLAARDGFKTDPSFESAYFTSLHTLLFKNFSTEIGFPVTNKFSEFRWHIKAAEIELDFQSGNVAVMVRDLLLEVEGKGSFEGSGKAELPFDWMKMGSYNQEMNKVYLEGKKLVDTGSTRILFDASGTLKFRIGKEMISTTVSSRHEGPLTYLEMSKDDVLKISHQVGDKLTRGEADIVSRHPIQAPTLFRIKNYAEDRARAAKTANPLVPEGSYRHILWNFLLTRQYGPEFTKMVTDAHEVGDREGEDMETHYTDYHNNAIGRRWALEKETTESDVLPRVLSDPKVIRKD